MGGVSARLTVAVALGLRAVGAPGGPLGAARRGRLRLEWGPARHGLAPLSARGGPERGLTPAV